MRKYRNQKYNGYDSKREAELAANLHALEKAGKISELAEQVPFVLIPRQTGKTRNEKSVKYLADFCYVDDQGRHVVDCKGFRTKEYIIKRKLMLKVHGIEIEEM